MTEDNIIQLAIESVRNAVNDVKRWSDFIFEEKHDQQKIKVAKAEEHLQEAKDSLQEARDFLEKACERQERILKEDAAAQKAKGDIIGLMPFIDKGWTAKWLREFHSKQIALRDLPSLGDLSEFIKQELPVKIAIPHRLREKWIFKMNTANPELLTKIFITSNTEPCVDFIFQIGSRVVDAVEPGLTETSFISFWDDMIRNVLNFVLSGIGTSDRYSSNLSSTGSNCPDYLFIVDSVCVFRGEEKAPGNRFETPRCELSEKMIWSHGNVPYLFGYAAVGFDARLYAITNVQTSSGDHVDAKVLGVFDLSDVAGRFHLLLALLNIARLFRTIASLCPESGMDEYTTLFRGNGIKIHIEPRRVVKCFPKTLFQHARSHLEEVYKILKDRSIPNVDHLHCVDSYHKRLIFHPRGDNKKPSTLAELFRALQDILRAVTELHKASWMHRDIRWANVMKQRDGTGSWFLIDFMDAAQSPQSAASGRHLSKKSMLPRSLTTPAIPWQLTSGL